MGAPELLFPDNVRRGKPGCCARADGGCWCLIKGSGGAFG
jgi:hypothetical protein